MSCNTENVRGALFGACFSSCAVMKKSMMEKLHEFENYGGFGDILLAAIQAKDDTIKPDCRLLASILLKNYLLRNWKGELLSIEEKYRFKKFLCGWFGEAECNVAVQLGCLTGKLARLEWPEWPELVPSLVSAIQMESFLHNLRAMYALDCLLLELLNAGSTPLLKTLCVQLFPIISKVWATFMKTFQAYLASLNLTCADVSSFGVRDHKMEARLYFLTVSTKVLKKILEVAFKEIIDKFATFKCFIKTYIATLQLISVFLRKARPLSIALIGQCVAGSHVKRVDCKVLHAMSEPVAAALQHGGIESCQQKRAAMQEDAKRFKLCDEDLEEVHDYYIAAEFIYEHNAGLFSVINGTLRLLKILASTPVLLQKQYPLEMLPYVEGLLSFFYLHLLEEYPEQLPGQRCHSAEQTTANHPLTAVQQRNLLPLKYLSLSAVSFLSNVLSCSAYDSNSAKEGASMEHELLEPTLLEWKREGMCGACDEIEQMRQQPPPLSLRKAFFDMGKVARLMSMLLSPLLNYCEVELEQWRDEPEQFYICQQSLTEGQTLKTAAEGLFCGLVDHAPNVVCGIIISMLQDLPRQMAISCPSHAEALASTSSAASRRKEYQAELMYWDAVYLCAGLAYASLVQLIDNPTAWLANFIAPVLNNLNQFASALGPASKQQRQPQLLKARILWMLSIWMSSFESVVLAEVLAMIVNSFGSQLDTGDDAGLDVVVQLHCLPLLQSITTMEVFSRSMLPAYIIPLTQGLCALCKTLEEVDTRTLALSIAGELVQILCVHPEKDKLICPLAEIIGDLWQHSGVQCPVRARIVEVSVILLRGCVMELQVMSDLVRAASLYSPSLHSMTIPLVAHCCGEHARKEQHSHLLGDGISLWLAVMRNIPGGQLSQELEELFHSVLYPLFAAANSHTMQCEGHPEAALEIFEEDDPFALVKEVLLIVEAYLLVGGKRFVQALVKRTPHQFTNIFAQLIGKVPPSMVLFLARPLEAALMVCPEGAMEMLYNSGLFMHMIKICAASARCKVLGSMLADFKEADVALVCYSSLVIRNMVYCPQLFLQCLSSLKHEILTYIYNTYGADMAQHSNLSEGILLVEIVEVALQKVDCLPFCRGALVRERLWCWFLLSLFPDPEQAHLSAQHAEGRDCSAASPPSSKSCWIRSLMKRFSYEPVLYDHCISQWSLKCSSYSALAQQPRPVPASVTPWGDCVSSDDLLRWFLPIAKIAHKVARDEKLVRAAMAAKDAHLPQNQQRLAGFYEHLDQLIGGPDADDCCVAFDASASSLGEGSMTDAVPPASYLEYTSTVEPIVVVFRNCLQSDPILQYSFHREGSAVEATFARKVAHLRALVSNNPEQRNKLEQLIELSANFT